MKLTNICLGCAPLAEPAPFTRTRGGIAFASEERQAERPAI